ncbi:MAG: protein kinase [Elusimicrobia bacterium]|nr:protein kinase [Elusimicrobiota bacterium]
MELSQAQRDPRLIAGALQARAFGAFQAGEYERAAADAKRILDMFPEDKDARVIYEFSKGRVGATSGEASAKPLLPDGLTASIYDDPRVAAAGRRASARVAAIKKLGEARTLVASGDAAAARMILDIAAAAQRLDPALADAAMQKALAWRTLNELARALAEVTRAIGLWSVQGQTKNLPAAYALRARLDNDLRDYPRALSDAGAALAYDPNFAAGYRERARAGESLSHKAEQVLADFKRAAELQPEYQADYEAALTRLSGSGKTAPPPVPAGWRTLLPFILGALAVVLAVAGWLSVRRPRPEAMIGFTRERKELDGQYQIVSPLGEGGMGAVFKGWDKTLKRPVAIKKLRAELQTNARERERFLKEAETVASLHHPHIVDIYNIIRHAEDTYLVFEYVSGVNLQELLDRSPGRHLAPARALEILRPIAEAVDHAHDRHVIHRDLKPANVMLADGGWVKVMDFGIARQVLDSLMMTTNTIVGTPVYMAPEQSRGALVKQSDVFSLGVTLYELLTGAQPFSGAGEIVEKLEGRFQAPSAVRPNLNTAIDAVLRKALSPRPEERYHRCGELYAAAAGALGEGVAGKN